MCVHMGWPGSRGRGADQGQLELLVFYRADACLFAGLQQAGLGTAKALVQGLARGFIVGQDCLSCVVQSTRLLAKKSGLLACVRCSKPLLLRIKFSAGGCTQHIMMMGRVHPCVGCLVSVWLWSLLCVSEDGMAVVDACWLSCLIQYSVASLTAAELRHSSVACRQLNSPQNSDAWPAWGQHTPL